MLREYQGLPLSLLRYDSNALADALGGPTLFHLPGERRPALFVSLLLHGNEEVGWLAIRRLLGRYVGRGELLLPRSLSLFVGNVAAARHGLRHLHGQPDYNRVWPGASCPPSAEVSCMAEVVRRMAARGVFASVDLHNNTGLNPHYACINRLQSEFIQLAALFSRTIVYFTRPVGVQSMAMAELAPAVTLECGKVGQQYGVAHAVEYLDACLHMQQLPAHDPAPQDYDLFHTVAQVRVRENVAFAFEGEAEPQLRFVSDLDRLNFRELPAGTVLAHTGSLADCPLEAVNNRGTDVGESYFSMSAGQLQLKVPVMPSMLTLDRDIIRSDCLGYLMERCNFRP